MANVLITGGAGFIASHLTQALLARGDQVTLFDIKNTQSTAQLQQCKMIIADVQNLKQIQKAMQSIDVCFHLANSPRVFKNLHQWPNYCSPYLSGLINIMKAAQSQNRHASVKVVYTSSSSVYGDNATPKLKETDELRPLCLDGADNLACELHARIAGQRHSINTCGFRLFNIYGAPTKDSNDVVSRFIHDIKQLQRVILYGDGKQCRDFVYIDDVIRYLLSGIKKACPSAPIYNICSGQATDIRTLAKSLFSLMNIKENIKLLPRLQGDVHTAIGDPQLAYEHLQLKTITPLTEGLLLSIHGTRFQHKKTTGTRSSQQVKTTHHPRLVFFDKSLRG
ncbi:MAG: NAD-dependent epimerase/dehydratase family protein [Pseudomonadales bacterium]|nr:NAD-dependent epimerase/dehydratase family protein [Pseudomonadales bacterium]